MLMGFDKVKLSIIERVREIFIGIEWLSLTVIPVHKVDGTWSEKVHPFEYRWDCFISSLDTAIRGYVYQIKPSKSSEYKLLR